MVNMYDSWVIRFLLNRINKQLPFKRFFIFLVLPSNETTMTKFNTLQKGCCWFCISEMADNQHSHLFKLKLQKAQLLLIAFPTRASQVKNGNCSLKLYHDSYFRTLWTLVSLCLPPLSFSLIRRRVRWIKTCRVLWWTTLCVQPANCDQPPANWNSFFGKIHFLLFESISLYIH